MRVGVSTSRQLTQPDALRGDGRIPFRIRIGVIGHIDLEPRRQLNEELRQQIARIADLLNTRPVGGRLQRVGQAVRIWLAELRDDQRPRPQSSTPIRLAIVSSLAKGGDRMGVRAVRAYAARRGHDAQVEAILPMPRETYARKQEFTGHIHDEFEELLEPPTWIFEPSKDLGISDEEAYEAAGRQLVARCDVLIALWDGRKTGRGGTAETLLHAAWRGKPCIWIQPCGAPVVSDNFHPGSSRPFYDDVTERVSLPEWRVPPEPALPEDVLAPLHEAHEGLDEFNREGLPEGFERNLEREFGAAAAPPWVARPFLRAALLAARYQTRFKTLAVSISLSAIFGAASLAASLSFSERELCAWLEVVFLLFAGLAFLAVRRGGYHRRWLSYRVLAERLRSAYYLAPTGVDFRRTARLEGIYVERHTEDWILRAFEEIWTQRPEASAPEPKLSEKRLAQLKRQLAEEWIGGQITFHHDKARRHGWRQELLSAAVVTSFVLTLFFAILHAHNVWHRASIFLSITLPTVGASLGVILTVGQHRALSRRYARMESELAVAQYAVREAESREQLALASSDAARTIAQETGDWFGAMWFLDIEHV
jgi:SMODS and SLOG-associating 2TM effector domain 1